MKSIVFIIPYFGKFPSGFQVFLDSCRNNEKVDWLIFTDNNSEYIFPKNVHVISTTFKELQDRIKSKFDFSPSIYKPYKLCDYKPIYGYLFEEYIQQYDYWGHCDVDMVFGDIRKFVTEEILNEYKKIFFLGHCTIFKNTPDNNRMFLQKIEGRERYKEILLSTENQSFDEEFKCSINNIYNLYKQKVFYEDYSANIFTKSSDFKITKWDFSQGNYLVEKKKKVLYIWKNGALIQYVFKNKKYTKREYLYIHLQSRKMKCDKYIQGCNIFKIIPNSYESLSIEDFKEEKLYKVKRKHFNMHYFKLRSKNLLIKAKKILDTRIKRKYNV